MGNEWQSDKREFQRHCLVLILGSAILKSGIKLGFFLKLHKEILSSSRGLANPPWAPMDREGTYDRSYPAFLCFPSLLFLHNLFYSSFSKNIDSLSLIGKFLANHPQLFRG